MADTENAATGTAVTGLTMGTGVGAGIAIAAGVVGAFASYKKSKAERKALLEQETLRKLEAAEMQRRADYNQDLLTKKLNRTFGTFSAGQGNLATTSDIQQRDREILLSDISNELDRAKMESEYAINMKLREAQALSNQAAAVNRNVPLQFASSALGTGSDLYSIYRKK